MNNIRSVHIENFQSHLDTYIEFDNGLNMIVGQSDSGKTAIIRAIRWALFNQPKGTDFLRVSADFVRVTVTLSNDTIICRERTSSKNRYSIKRPEQDDLILEGFGFSVPHEVLEAHGMGHLRVDTDRDLALHVSQQLDGPFLLEETSSTRAKVLGRISGAHYLDMAIRQTSRDVSQLNQRVRHEEEAIEKLEKELEPYANVDQLKKELDNVSHKISEISILIEKKQQLERISNLMKQMTEEEVVQSRNKKLVQHVHEWEAVVSQLEVSTTKYQAFVRLQTRYNQLQDSMEKCLLWIEKTKDVMKANENTHSLDRILKKANRLMQLQQLSKKVSEQHQKQIQSVQLTSFLSEIEDNLVDEINQKKSN
ncbi:AAA family ATPase [Bacillus sp. JCM 19034]|uniref:AAA family ATPase n=1 Tax=Bacillus sp. JCM 19034 TaxID=1481928 RepID=UPI0007825FA7|nr:AAA family ATPase [Bacillus sp. JCM 19034]